LKSAGELLELACRRIADLDTPAYVKNSELRYVAVNEAYARFLGREISDFIGRRSRELLDRPEERIVRTRSAARWYSPLRKTQSASMRRASAMNASR